MERRLIQNARVVGQRQLCREHYRLTLRIENFPSAQPGQFVHLSPSPPPPQSYNMHEQDSIRSHQNWPTTHNSPLLPRAFSIADLTRIDDHIHIDVIYRVVGSATRWMESLSAGDMVSMLGPLGNKFPIRNDKPFAWCVAGGVGLPPMLWLSEALHRADRKTVAFCGAQTADLLALNMDQKHLPVKDAKVAALSSEEFNNNNVPVIISTDDGSLGFSGHIGAALTSYYDANSVPSDDLVVYTCGPERMMEFVAHFCIDHAISCFVCMERAMACGTGMCQSCVVPIHDETDDQGWRYQLCCTDGPIFEANDILWEPVSIS